MKTTATSRRGKLNTAGIGRAIAPRFSIEHCWSAIRVGSLCLSIIRAVRVSSALVSLVALVGMGRAAEDDYFPLGS
jgi:hypothetical protein